MFSRSIGPVARYYELEDGKEGGLETEEGVWPQAFIWLKSSSSQQNPLECLHKKRPNYSVLKIIGCQCN